MEELNFTISFGIRCGHVTCLANEVWHKATCYLQEEVGDHAVLCSFLSLFLTVTGKDPDSGCVVSLGPMVAMKQSRAPSNPQETLSRNEEKKIVLNHQAWGVVCLRITT